MGEWTYSRSATSGGRFLLAITKLTQGGVRADVTAFRGAPTIIDSYSSGDPFGDSTAVLRFPAITPFDDLEAADLAPWLGYYSNVDLYWAPAIDPGDGIYPDREHVIDPATNSIHSGLVAPYRLRNNAGHLGAINAIKVWEGFTASFTPSGDGLQVQCQGALFQLDRYLAKPFYPARPWPLEKLIEDAFSTKTRPHLRTAPLQTVWPTGWARVVPKYSGGSADVYSPVALPGSKWTGYTSRETGGWDHSLTGFVQDQLTVMVTRPGDGVAIGNQWTILQQLSGVTGRGRIPVLQIRDRFRNPDFGVWVGAPGVDVNLTGDSTQSENIVFGSGTDVNGTVWRNAVISNDGSRTDYLPLAAGKDVYPYQHNTALVKGGFVSEAVTKFSTGFSQPDATDVAKQNLARDRTPGWAGSITLSTDPSTVLSRWQVRAGMTVALQGFLGSGVRGIPLHISAVTVNPEGGTVELTVDTRYRDLLTVQEAMERTRDPLTPVKMLQVNRQSVMVADVQAPWDYTAGSGYVPKASKAFHDYCPVSQVFPYTDWAGKHPPLRYPGWYVKVTAGAATREKRWSDAISVYTAEKGDIARTEFACYDQYGRILAIPFHVSFWYFKPNPWHMPFDADGPSPYINNAFESIDPSTGQQWPEGSHLKPEDGFILGWGNRQNGIYNRAGFSPGSEVDGDQPTGLLTDDASWHFDNTNNPNYNTHLAVGKRQSESALTIYAMFYAEHWESVYFMGRLFKSNPGSTS